MRHFLNAKAKVQSTLCPTETILNLQRQVLFANTTAHVRLWQPSVRRAMAFINCHVRRRPARLIITCMLCCFVYGAASLPSANIEHRLLEEVEALMKHRANAPIGMPDFQAAALAEFASGLDADPHGALPLWTGDSHPCGDVSNNFQAWPGVGCNAPTGLVTNISLPGKGLTGTLPRSLSVLKSLRILDLSNNSFYGSMPSRWSNLTSLESLILTNNHVTGTLPASFSVWESVQMIELRENQLTGSLPGSWAGMGLLEVVDLSNNRLNGTLPDSWCRMEFLSILDLHANNLSGFLPSSWTKLTSLLQLNLGENQIEGVLPSQWAVGMDSLRAVNVSGNSLSGTLPDEWQNMTSLQTLSVSENRLTGSIPEAWGTLSSLYAVNITQNTGLCGYVPDLVLGVLAGTNATNIYRRCPWETEAEQLIAFKDALQDPLGKLASWRAGSNPCALAGTWEGVECQNGSVITVKLISTALRGSLTDGLAQLPNLRAIYLKNNQLTGTLPSSWGRGPANLLNIDLAANDLSGVLPASWGQLGQLQTLDLSDNQLEGPLPTEWSWMHSLTALYLGRNTLLNGTLPTSWSGLTALERAHVDSTSIEGSLPATWAKLARMQELELSNNMLTGAVPIGWGGNLTYLGLKGNRHMCGYLYDLPDNVTLQMSMTDLGRQCKAGKGLSLTAAIAVGVCSSFAGAALLAGAAYLMVRARRDWAQVRVPAALQAAAAAPGPGAMVGRPPTPDYTPATPIAARGMPVPPCSPCLSAYNPAVVAGVSPSQHRLASSSTSFTAEFICQGSLLGAAGLGENTRTASPAGLQMGQQHAAISSHPLSNLRENSAPVSTAAGTSPMQRSQGSSTALSAGGIAGLPRAALFGTGSVESAASASNTAPALNLAPESYSPSPEPSFGNLAGTIAAAALPAFVSPSSRLPVEPITAIVGQSSGANSPRSGERTPRNTSHSLPESPGAWGSAVKGFQPGAFNSTPPRASRTPNIDGLRVRMEQLLGRSAAAEGNAEAAAPAMMTIAEVELAASVPLDEEAAEISPVAAAAAENQHAGDLVSAETADATAVEEAASDADGVAGDVDLGSPSAQGSRGVGSFTVLAWPRSPISHIAPEGSVPSPRGVAALMAAGVGGVLPAGAGEALADAAAAAQQHQ